MLNDVRDAGGIRKPMRERDGTGISIVHDRRLTFAAVTSR
jgi:hypothetical protein